jgi:hypothetical protein
MSVRMVSSWAMPKLRQTVGFVGRAWAPLRRRRGRKNNARQDTPSCRAKFLGAEGAVYAEDGTTAVNVTIFPRKPSARVRVPTKIRVPTGKTPHFAVTMEVMLLTLASSAGS